MEESKGTPALEKSIDSALFYQVAPLASNKELDRAKSANSGQILKEKPTDKENMKIGLQETFTKQISLAHEPEPEIRLKTGELVSKFQKDPYMPGDVNGSGGLLQSQRYFINESMNTNYSDRIVNKEKVKRICIFRQDQRFRICWDICVIMLALWNVFFIPLNISIKPQFGQTVTVIFLNYFIDFVFLVDIVVNVRTSYINNEGEEIMDPKLITQNYLQSGRFFLDFLAIIPLDAIPGLNFFEFLGILKLIRIFRVPKLIKKVSLTETTKNVIKVFEVILLLIILYHITACVWYLVVSFSNQWIPPVNWISKDDYGRSFYQDFSVEKAYLQVLYYGVMGLNSGEIGPQTTLSLGLAILLMFFGMFINALLFGTMAELTLQLGRKERAQQENLDTANTIMMNMKIPIQDRRAVVKYLVEIQSTKARQQELMWLQSTISPFILEQVRFEIFGKMIAHNEIFDSIMSNPTNEREVINREILARLEIKHFEPEQTILQYEGEATQMYFVARGKVLINQKNIPMRRYSTIRVLKEGQHFGEIGVLFNSPRTMQATAYKYCILARMSKTNLLSMGGWYPEILQEFKNHVLTYKDDIKTTLQKVLPRSALFRGLEPHDLLNVIYSFKMLSIQPGQFIFERDTETKGLYVIIKGFATLVLDLKGFHFPLKILKAGHIYGYDSLIIPNVHILSMSCSNYKYVQIKGKKWKRGSSYDPSNNSFRLNESIDYFASNRKMSNERDNGSFINNESMQGSILSLPQRSSYITENYSLKPDVLFEARQDLKEQNFSGMALRLKSQQRKSQFSDRLNQSSFGNGYTKSPKTKKVINVKRESAHSAVAFLSNENYEKLLREIPQLKKNALTESERIQFQELRPYLMDYYIPYKAPKKMSLSEKIQFTTKKQGGRNNMFKVKNAVLYTILNNRHFQSNLSKSDVFLDFLHKSEESGRALNYNHSLNRMRFKTTSNRLRTMVMGPEDNVVSQIKSTQAQLNAQISVVSSKVQHHNSQVLKLRENIIQAQTQVEKLVERLKIAEEVVNEEEEKSEEKDEKKEENDEFNLLYGQNLEVESEEGEEDDKLIQKVSY